MGEWRAANSRMRLDGTLHVDLMVDTRMDSCRSQFQRIRVRLRPKERNEDEKG